MESNIEIKQADDISTVYRIILAAEILSMTAIYSVSAGISSQIFVSSSGLDSRRPSVCLSSASTFSKICSPDTARPIEAKFH